MNRLQKKCLIATTGFHLLLVVILIVGPGFFTEKPKPDDASILDVIPDQAIEATLTSGEKNAKPPAPTPIATPTPPVVPPPPQPEPKPDVTPPPEPKPEPKTFTEKVKEIFTPEPVKPDPDPEPAPKPVKPAKPVKPKPQHEIKIDLTQKVTRTAQTDDAAQKAAAEARRQQREARQLAQARADAFRAAAQNLQNNFTPSTKVAMPGHSSVSYAGYASIIKSIYTRRWQMPKNAANDEANTTVSITVSSDGRVISSKIIDRSGDSDVDASVQQTLDRVDFIAPFPDGATEKTKTFIIDFNLKAKRMFG